MSFSIAGKVAIVTGAANGVGLAIARHFVSQGASVVFADKDEDRLKAEVAALSDTDGRAISFASDLREKLAQANLLSATIDAFERVDILINASRQVLLSNALNPDEDAFETLLSQNLVLNLRISQTVAKRMISQHEAAGDPEASAGSIVNLTSISADRAHPDLLAYSVSNAGLNQLTRSLAVALSANRIRVNAVSFGSIMSASLRDKLREDDSIRQKIIDATPLAKIGEADEVAEAAQFLSSDSSSFVTGQILTVDGGRSILDAAQVSAH
jgi:7-alpha-hydroxysteroid dehydrogenase